MSQIFLPLFANLALLHFPISPTEFVHELAIPYPVDEEDKEELDGDEESESDAEDFGVGEETSQTGGNWMHDDVESGVGSAMMGWQR
jgi:hypothetical protein